MTEAVCLALIALLGTVIFLIGLIVLIKSVLHKNPTHFMLYTKYGSCEIDFDTKAIDK